MASVSAHASSFRPARNSIRKKGAQPTVRRLRRMEQASLCDMEAYLDDQDQAVREVAMRRLVDFLAMQTRCAYGDLAQGDICQ